MRSIDPPAPPDTVTGTVHADDPDGLDSLWVRVDTAVTRVDGGLARSFSTRFRFPVGPGKTPTAQVPVEFRARDIAGFEVRRDTYVVVVP